MQLQQLRLAPPRRSQIFLMSCGAAFSRAFSRLLSSFPSVEYLRCELLQLDNTAGPSNSGRFAAVRPPRVTKNAKRVADPTPSRGGRGRRLLQDATPREPERGLDTRAGCFHRKKSGSIRMGQRSSD